MSTEIGTVVSVTVRDVTTNVVGDLPIGSTTMVLDDVTVLDEDGGTLAYQTADGATAAIGYTAIDEDTQTVTLAEQTPGLISDAALVTPWPAVATEVTAAVQVDDAGEAIDPVYVPASLQPILSEGNRDDDSAETVVISNDSGVWAITEIYGELATIDAGSIEGIIDSTTTQISDGLPPASSPAVTVKGLPKNIVMLSWPAVSNVDPVTYELHCSTATGAVAPTTAPTAGDPTTLVATSQGSQTTVAAMADGTALAYGTVYWFACIARDIDGAASASAWVSGGPSQAEAVDIAANSITAEKIAAQTLTGVTMQTADSGARTVISTPTDGSGGRMAWFLGIANEVAATLTQWTQTIIGGGGRNGITISSGTTPTWNASGDLTIFAGKTSASGGTGVGVAQVNGALDVEASGSKLLVGLTTGRIQLIDGEVNIGAPGLGSAATPTANNRLDISSDGIFARIGTRFAAAISGTSAAFSSTLNAASATISGLLTAGSAAITGALETGSLTVNAGANIGGALNGTVAAFSGSFSAPGLQLPTVCIAKPSTNTQAVASSTSTVGLTALSTVRGNNQPFACMDLTNSNQITVTRAGRYRIEAALSYSANSSGTRELAILINGATMTDGRGSMTDSATPTNSWNKTVTATANLAAGTVISIGTWQNSGSSLNAYGALTVNWEGSYS